MREQFIQTMDSLGAATHPFCSKRTALKRVAKQMVSEADQAMYHSKSSGRNHFSHFADLPGKNTAKGSP